ncbi:SDR family NAD(P)-dependent oxidoreductase [Streptomyces sp. NPDC050355]|uniref:SDR family NAD(P)-dependent oxidoreductase n=1 Tax=Streptomyces sp. NPDC050355 TaxID=3365609 RepID=UPI00379EF7D3
MPVAIITGASKGLGRALARALAERGWDLVVDARSAGPLAEAARELRGAGARVVALPGDVADGGHRAALVAAAGELGGLDLLVNNASALGAEPLVRLAELPVAGLRRALEVNVVAPLGLIKEALPLLRNSSYFSYPPSYEGEAPYIGDAPFRGDGYPTEAYDTHPYSENSQNSDLSDSHPYVGVHGAVLTVSSDAAVEAYPTWGGYGASKAALEQLSAVLAVEEPGLRVWWVDPGDMRTELYAAAVPDDDDSGRPLPQAVVPALLRLLDGAAVSGRYTAAEPLPAPDGASSR